jgi:hypothetical protein
MSLPPDVITSVFLKPSFNASGPISSWLRERVELLDRERLEKFGPAWRPFLAVTDRMAADRAGR